KRNSKNGSCGKILRWCRDPSTACRKRRGTPVGMTRRERAPRSIVRTHPEKFSVLSFREENPRSTDRNVCATLKKPQDPGRKANLGHPAKRENCAEGTEGAEFAEKGRSI